MVLIIDTKIASEFCKGFITATAFRAYLKPLLEAAVAGKPPVSPVSPTFGNGPITHKDKAKALMTAINDGEFAVDAWEAKFISDQCYVNSPSEPQEARLGMLWNRYQDSMS